MTELETIAAQLKVGQPGPPPAPEDVFGPGGNEHDVNAVYRRIASLVHPDKHGGAQQALAQAATARLNEVQGNAIKKLRAGVYGQRDVAPPMPLPAFTPMAVKVGPRSYMLQRRLPDGDICELYTCSIDGAEPKAIFKVAQHASDNDLVENEAKTLTHLRPPKDEPPKEKVAHLLTRSIDSFMLRTSSSQRRVSVLPWHRGLHSLAEVRAAYSNGIDYRDMAWMFKRLLAALDYAHSKGVVHGAVLPPHVLINTANHGAKLIDWCHAVKGAGRVKAISAPHRDWYPPEVLAKRNVTPATDIYMAALCAIELMSSSSPREIRAFLEGCMLANPARRPDNAGQLHEEFDKLLERLVGPRAFREFTMPASRAL